MNRWIDMIRSWLMTITMNESMYGYDQIVVEDDNNDVNDYDLNNDRDDDVSFFHHLSSQHIILTSRYCLGVFDTTRDEHVAAARSLSIVHHMSR
jgi:hypothetical protein